MEVKWEIKDEDLIKLLIEEYDFEAKNYIDAQLLLFFEQHKDEIKKYIKEYIESPEFKNKILEKIDKQFESVLEDGCGFCG